MFEDVPDISDAELDSLMAKPEEDPTYPRGIASLPPARLGHVIFDVMRGQDYKVVPAQTGGQLEDMPI